MYLVIELFLQDILFSHIHFTSRVQTKVVCTLRILFLSSKTIQRYKLMWYEIINLFNTIINIKLNMAKLYSVFKIAAHKSVLKS